MAESPDDKEHKRIMRDLRQQGQAAVTWGLPNPATEASVLGMGLVLRDRMSMGTGADRASAAAELAAVMLDKTVQKLPQSAAVECAKGCNYCCHGSVAVSAPEVFRVARLVMANDGSSAMGASQVAARARARTAATVEAVLSLRDPCPLLVEGVCGAYDNRPMGCRQFISTDMEGCRTAFQKGASDLPFVPAGVNAGVIVRALLMSAAASLALKTENYELSSALSVALSEKDAEARWLAGEDVLASAVKVPLAPKMRESAQRWSDMLGGLFQ